MTNLIKAAVGDALRHAGFTKKSDTWYRETPGAVSIVNVQKSQFGNQFYVNLAVWPNELGIAKWPKENQGHIRTRLETIAPEGTNTLFDLDNSAINDQERRRRIETIIRDVAVPWLAALGSLNQITGVLKSDKLSSAIIHKKVREGLDAGG